MFRVIHFEIYATDPPQTIEFFERLFNWRFSRWKESDSWLIDTGPADQPGINGALLPRHSGAPAAGQPLNSFICTIQVPEVDSILEQAITLGGRVEGPKFAVPAVGWVAYITDPSGNICGLLQLDPAAI